MTCALPLIPYAASADAITPFLAVRPGCNCLARNPPWLVRPGAIDAASDSAYAAVAWSNLPSRAQAAAAAILPSVMVLSQPRR